MAYDLVTGRLAGWLGPGRVSGWLAGAVIAVLLNAWSLGEGARGWG